MTDNNELIVPQQSTELAEAFDDVVESTSFFRRVQLFGSKSAAVTEDKILKRHFGIPDGEDIIDLGESLQAIPLAYLPKAMYWDGEDMEVSYDPKSEKFRKFKEEAGVKDSGCMYGIDFLLWVVEAEEFLSFYLATKTNRKLAPDFRAQLGQRVTLGSRVIKTKQYTWEAPTIQPCPTPFEKMPDQEVVTSKIADFQNLPRQQLEREAEAVEEGEEERVR